MKLSIFLTLLLSFWSDFALACASCGCTISPGWDLGAPKQLSLDLRYDYLNQNQLRSGRSEISPTVASQSSTNGNAQEVESFTRNNYINAKIGYSFDQDWSLALETPYIFRTHSTLGTASDGTTPGVGGGQYDSNTASLGDTKITGSYFGFFPSHLFGLLLGLKLPTGKYNLSGSSTDSTNPGPVTIDRGLQPGTGTLDGILGILFFQALNKNWDLFAESILQSALDDRQSYRPGNSYTFNVGARFFGLSSVIPQLQTNMRYVLPDSGVNADTVSTGGTLLYISPGLGIPLFDGMQLNATLQLPVYQYARGVQLAPRSIESLALHYLF